MTKLDNYSYAVLREMLNLLPQPDSPALERYRYAIAFACANCVMRIVLAYLHIVCD